IRERYRWLPYNYTLAWENASEGMPLVRPINFYVKGDSPYDNVKDEYLWGRDILVAPVLTQGASERQVIFPEGEWLDLLAPDGNIYQGGDTVMYPAPLDVLPLFVRGGSFIPTADYKMNNTGDYRTGSYTINYYPTSGESTYTLFEDNLTSTTSIKDGNYRLITFKGEAGSDSIVIDITSAGSYSEARKNVELSFIVHRIESRPAGVSVDGKEIKGWKFDEKAHTLSFRYTYSADSEIRITIAR
ncbi:MAG: DUF5110 domain-containing protein, partial [Duncaniella sp.]|nr:DUF5110 domain-containing protein [Duncaniella sp.]